MQLTLDQVCDHVAAQHLPERAPDVRSAQEVSGLSNSEGTERPYIDLIRLTCRDETGTAPGMADRESENSALKAVETIERAQRRTTATRGPSTVRSQLRSLPEVLPGGVRGLMYQEEGFLLRS